MTTPSILASSAAYLTTPDPRGPVAFHHLPPSEFRSSDRPIAFVNLEKEGIVELGEWRVVRSGARAMIIWEAVKPCGILEHSRTFQLIPTPCHSVLTNRTSAVPTEVFPETLHSSLGRKMHVTFPLPHDEDEAHFLTWRGERSHSSKDIVPEYLFHSREARRIFQSDVRDKDLVDGGTFDTDIIWTDRTESKQSKRESYSQDLKIWRGRGNQTGRYSLSFKITTNGPYQNRHVECGLDRFGATARTGAKDTRIVYLDFVSTERDSQGTLASTGDEGPSSPAGPPRKKRGLSGIFSRPQLQGTYLGPVPRPTSRLPCLDPHGC
jgi:hypothetical protein